MPDFIQCQPDLIKPDRLKPCEFVVSDNLTFIDRVLPPTNCVLVENIEFSSSYFVDLHEKVKFYGVHNYRGAKIPLQHNGINVTKFRDYLLKFEYPHIHLMQFIEFGFPLGLWSEAFLVPSVQNHSSAYSYYSYVD